MIGNDKFKKMLEAESRRIERGGNTRYHELSYLAGIDYAKKVYDDTTIDDMLAKLNSLGMNVCVSRKPK